MFHKYPNFFVWSYCLVLLLGLAPVKKMLDARSQSHALDSQSLNVGVNRGRLQRERETKRVKTTRKT